jgi:hypothetical protein
MTWLQSLDFSKNDFCGQIPPDLGSLNYLGPLIFLTTIFHVVFHMEHNWQHLIDCHIHRIQKCGDAHFSENVLRQNKIKLLVLSSLHLLLK